MIHLCFGEVWCDRFPMAGHLCVVLRERICEMVFAAEPQLWLAVSAWHHSLSEAGYPVEALDMPSFGPKLPVIQGPLQLS